MAEAAKLNILINADDKASATMSRLQRNMGGLRKAGMAMTAAGAALVAGMVLSIKSYNEAGNEVQKLALKTGFSTEALSEWRHAAEISGASLGSLGKGVKTMASFMFDAEKGLSTQKDALEELSLTIKDFEGLSPEEQFKKFAFAIGEVEDPMRRSALAEDVFGRAGVQLLPLLAEGKEGMEALAQEAHTLGIVFDQEMANKAASMVDSMDRMKKSIEGVKMAIADELIPILEPLIQGITEITKGIRGWMDENPELVKAIGKVALIVAPLLLVLGPLLIMLPGIALALPVLGAAFAVLLGPVGLVVAAIAGLITAGVLLWKNWDTIKAKSIEIWGGLVGFFVGIKDKIASVFVGLGGVIKDALNSSLDSLRNFSWNFPGLNVLGRQIIPSFNLAPFKDLPNFKAGGIVPGPIGAPVPIIAHGGERFAGAGGALNPVINVYVQGSVVTERDLRNSLREAFIELKAANTTTGF